MTARWWRVFQGAVGAVALAVGLSIGACGDASGCSDFNPRSEPIAPGQHQEIEVEVVDGGWGIVDADDGYWSTEGVPHPQAEDGETLRGVATLTPDGLRVDFGEHGVVIFPNTYGCE